MTTGAAPDGAFTGRWRARRPGAAHPRCRMWRKVIRTGRDERTLLRFSRISIARCTDLIRSSASAWGPLSVSPPRHGSARHGPTSLRTGPSADRRAQAVRPEGGGVRWRSSWRSLLLVPGGVLSGYPAWPVRGAASQRAEPATSRIGVSDDGARNLVRQCRGGSELLGVACQCPAALCGSGSRLNRRRVLPVRRHLE